MGVTRDRSRADGVLFALTTATTIICLPIAELLSRLNIVSETSPDVGAVRNVGTLGVLLAVTAAIRAFERWQLSRGFSKIEADTFTCDEHHFTCSRLVAGKDWPRFETTGQIRDYRSSASLALNRRQAVSIIAAATVGLALAQSSGRTTR